MTTFLLMLLSWNIGWLMGVFFCLWYDDRGCQLISGLARKFGGRGGEL